MCVEPPNFTKISPLYSLSSYTGRFTIFNAGVYQVTINMNLETSGNSLMFVQFNDSYTSNLLSMGYPFEPNRMSIISTTNVVTVNQT